MNDLAPRLACIVFVRMGDFSRKPVQEQAQLSSQLHGLVESVLADLPADDRLVLDVPGGAAIVVPDNPAAAMTIAERLHARSSSLSLCIGLNHGPVKLAEIGNSTEMIGDGLLSAATTAEFAVPERWLAARAFRDALAQTAPEQAERLAPAGLFTDTQVRAHELYALDPRAARRRRLRLLAGGTVAVVLILGAGLAARAVLKKPPPAPQQPPFVLPARITLDIKPAGDVYVDGELKGQAPALTEIYLKPGKHRIEVRHGGQPPLVSEMELRPAEKISLTHRFAAPAQSAPPRKIGRDTLPASGNNAPSGEREESVMQKLRRKLGL